jgi:hypothetical protein
MAAAMWGWDLQRRRSLRERPVDLQRAGRSGAERRARIREASRGEKG